MSVNRLVTVMLLMLLACGVGFAYRGYSVSWENHDTFALTFNLEDYALEPVQADGQVFTRLFFEGSVWTNRRGFAELPVISASIQLPDSGDFDLQVLFDDCESVSLDHPMLPSKGVIYRNQNPDAIPYWIHPEAEALRIFPAQVAHLGNPFIYRDVRGLTVFVSPFQYLAGESRLTVHHTLRLALVPRGGQKSTNPLTATRRSLAREMDEAYRSLFINYDLQEQGLKFDHELGEMGEMLVIYTSRDATAIEPYLAWKRQNGYKVHTQQVATDTNVKTTIQSAYTANPNLLYVQLVGDWADLKSDLGPSSAPTDPMLGCVAGSDNFPDLIIGRFPAASAAEVTLMINKAINYEKYPSGTWYTQGLGIGSNEGATSGDDGEIDYVHIDVIKENKLLPYTYTSVTEAYGSPSDTVVANAVNAGLSVINYCGHGSDTSWSTSGFNNADVSALTNGAMLPVIYSVACVNGTFHKTSECFAEAWLRKSGGGAVAVLMSTINQPWQPPMRGQDYMNDLLTGGYDYAAGPGNGTSTTYGKTTFGSTAFNGMVLMYAESAGSDDLDTIKTWTLFGDASLQVRTDGPQTLQVTYDEGMILGQDQFAVSVQTSARAAVAGARVYAVSSSQPAVEAFGVTDANGNVTLSFTTPPSETGTLNITVTGLNLMSHLGTAAIVPGAPCDPPSNLVAVNAAENDVLLTWDASAHADGGYQIYRATAGCAGPFTLMGTVPNGSGWHDTTVSGGVTYYYKVRSVCGGYGGILYTDCLDVLATGDCLLAPSFGGVTSVDAPTEQSCQLVLNWDAATSNCPLYPAVSYNIYRSEVSGGPYPRIASSVSGVSYTDFGVESGNTYFYLVRAVDAGGNEDGNTVEMFGTPLGPVVISFSDDMEGLEPNGWTHSAASGSDDWHYVTTESHSATHSWFASNPGTVKDDRLVTPAFAITGAAELSFWHYYNVESGYDGCVLEISMDGGTNYADLGAVITQNGYTGSIATGYSNPLAGRQAWTGNNAAWQEVLVDLAAYQGQTVNLRFRIGTDSMIEDVGWYVDDVVISQSSACETTLEVDGDLNLDYDCNAVDAVILGNFLSACIQHGEGGFTAPLLKADLDGSTGVDAIDLVLLLLML